MSAGYDKAFEIVNKIKNMFPESVRNGIAKFNEYIYKAYNLIKPFLDKINIGLTIKFTEDYVQSISNKIPTISDMQKLKPIYENLQNLQRNSIESYLAKQITMTELETQLYQTKADFEAGVKTYYNKIDSENPVYIPKESIKKIKLSRLFQRVITNFSTDARAQEVSPKYAGVTLEDNVVLAVDFVENNFDEAMRIVNNTAQEPANILKTNIAIATFTKASEDNNTDLSQEIIIKSSLRGTRYGQEIKALEGFGDQHSAARYIKKVLDSRMSDALMKTRLSFNLAEDLTTAQVKQKAAENLTNASFKFIDNLKEKAFKLIDWIKSKVC